MAHREKGAVTEKPERSLTSLSEKNLTNHVAMCHDDNTGQLYFLNRYEYKSGSPS